jgi:protease-4
MKQFFKMVFASMVGYILAAVIVVLIVVGIAAAAFSGLDSKKKSEVKDNSVLHLKLSFNIPERTPNNPFKYFNSEGESEMPLGLNDILDDIKRAKSDAKIKGIFIDVQSVGGGWATVEEIRNALIDFKKSKKWIVAYAELYSKGAYYLASVADKVYLNNSGEVIFNGMYSEVTFFKEALEKLGIEMQIIRHGKFKGAVEPFFLNKLSAENKEQISVYLNSLWNQYLTGIAESRKISKDELNHIADDFLVKKAEDAKAYKLVDELAYKDQVLTDIRKRLGKGENDKIEFVSMAKYANADEGAEGEGKDRIAVIYANGDINSGNGGEDQIGSEGLSEVIRKVRLDDKIKAIVLRVNSPGGSALASDIIWREVMLAKAAKPVVVSMGDVAASGGYYIACAADSIFAQPNTITGSIGVFGLLPNVSKLMNEKLGIHTDGVKIGKYSDLGKIDRALTADEMAIMQKYVDETYDQFISRVAAGRKMDKTKVDELGQGRVWTGADAKRLGLVDRLGSMKDAMDCAARMAKLTNYKVRSYPKQKDPLENLMKSFSGDGEAYFAQKELGEYYTLYQQFKTIKNASGIQARMGYWIETK